MFTSEGAATKSTEGSAWISFASSRIRRTPGDFVLRPMMVTRWKLGGLWVEVIGWRRRHFGRIRWIMDFHRHIRCNLIRNFITLTLHFTRSRYKKGGMEYITSCDNSLTVSFDSSSFRADPMHKYLSTEFQKVNTKKVQIR